MTSLIPLEGGSDNPVYAADQPLAEGGIPPIRRFKFVSPGYISAIGSHLIAGRDLTWNELYNRVPVALVSETWRASFGAIPARLSANVSAPHSRTTGGK